MDAPRSDQAKARVTGTPPIHGLMAEFVNSEELLAATRRTYQEGYRRLDAYSPLPVEGLAEAIGFHRTAVPLIVLIGALIGCLGGFYMQYWIAAIDFPINVGGRPLLSWPSFIPVTFELTILFGGLSALIGMLALNGLPMPYHSVFNVPRFELATQNRFFLCIEATDPKFDREATRRFLQGLRPEGVYDVDH